MTRLLVAAAVMLTAAAPATGQDDRPAAEELAARAASYVAHFVARFADVVAEEQYEQRVPSQRRTRQLTSDFLLVRPGGTGDFLFFRDVFAVDGRPVRDREQRLERLFLSARGDVLTQAAAIARASSRYNLEGIGSLNNPLLALAVLQDRYRSRFRLTLAGRDREVGGDVWVVNYTEFQRPTVLRGNGNRDVYARVLAWVDRPTGRVHKTEIEVGGGGIVFGSRVETTFAPDERFGVLVPTVMREWHNAGAYDVTGVATYGRFRRFGVATEEMLEK